MKTQYFLFSDDADSNQRTWLTLSELGAPTLKQISVDELGHLASNKSVTLVLDGRKVRLLDAVVPGKSKTQIERAAKYVIEDELASDIEETGVFLGQITDNEVDLAIANREWLRSEIENVDSLGVTVSHVVSETMFGCSDQGVLEVYIDNAIAHVITPSGKNYKVSNSLWPALIRKLLAAEDIKKLAIYQSIHPTGDDELNALCNSLGDQATVQLEYTDKRYTEWLIGRPKCFEDSLFIDLLPADLSKSLPSFFASKWARAAVALLAISLCVHVGDVWRDTARLKTSLAAVKDQQNSVFRQGFPEIGRIVNAEAQAQRTVKLLKQQAPPAGSFLKLFYDSAELLTDADSVITLVGATYSDSVLLLRIRSDSIGDIENYRKRLSTVLTAEVVTADARDDFVQGAIRVIQQDDRAP